MLGIVFAQYLSFVFSIYFNDPVLTRQANATREAGRNAIILAICNATTFSKDIQADFKV
jgi:hypothetical protein